MKSKDQKFILTGTVAIFLIIFFSGCVLDRDIHPIKISRFDWLIDNVDYSFRPTSEFTHCFISFWFYFEGDAEFEDFNYAKINFPDGYSYWDILFDKSLFNKKEKYIGGWASFYADADTLPLGPFTLELQIKPDVIIKYPFTIPPPGSNIPVEYAYTYTEDTTPSSSMDYSMLKRAHFGDTTVDAVYDIFMIDFMINDSKAYNGYIWFYDMNNEFIGVTYYFRDVYEGSINNMLNSGLAFNTNGTKNTLYITPSKIYYPYGGYFEQIKSCRIVLIDQLEYADETIYKPFHCRSVSENKIF
jgi:hypothetical protein